jgi:hypothetical protein
LTEISMDSALKFQFKESSLAKFWLHVRNHYPELSSKAHKVLIPFLATYLCEKDFSPLVCLKKYRNSLRNVQSALRIQLSEIKPNTEKLVAEMQHKPSH